jgi:hypothetical protein
LRRDSLFDISSVTNLPGGHFGLKHVRAAEYLCGLSAEVNQHFVLPGWNEVQPRKRRHDVNATGLHADFEEYLQLGKIAGSMYLVGTPNLATARNSFCALDSTGSIQRPRSFM